MLQSDANRMKSFACPGGVEVIVGYFRQIKNHLVLFGDFMPQQDEQIIDFDRAPFATPKTGRFGITDRSETVHSIFRPKRKLASQSAGIAASFVWRKRSVRRKNFIVQGNIAISLANN